jgi:hypothetical protein
LPAVGGYGLVATTLYCDPCGPVKPMELGVTVLLKE